MIIIKSSNNPIVDVLRPAQKLQVWNAYIPERGTSPSKNGKLTIKALVLLLLTFCLLLHPLWESVIVLRFVLRYFMSILVLQSS